MVAGTGGHESENSIGVGYSAQILSTPDASNPLRNWANSILDRLARNRQARVKVELGAFVLGAASYAPVVIDKFATGKPLLAVDVLIFLGLSKATGLVTWAFLERYTRAHEAATIQDMVPK